MYGSIEELMDNENVEFIVAPKPDGSLELDGVDLSWGWHGENLQTMQNIDQDRIFTVICGDDDMYITHGFHRVNRMYHLVAKEPFTKEWSDDCLL